MNEQEFQGKLAELMGEITTLPPRERKKLEAIADESRQRHARLRQTVSNLIDRFSRRNAPIRPSL